MRWGSLYGNNGRILAIWFYFVICMLLAGKVQAAVSAAGVPVADPRMSLGRREATDRSDQLSQCAR